MTKAPSPLLGYNNNVRHKNRVFHIQTEDSGVKRPHIITHLFMDGGRILKSVKTSYAEHIGKDKLGDVVRQLMKDQHKSMFRALRDGEFDAIVDEAIANPGKKSQPAMLAPKIVARPAVSSDGVESGPVTLRDLPPDEERPLTLDLDALAAEQSGQFKPQADLPPPAKNVLSAKAEPGTGRYRTVEERERPASSRTKSPSPASARGKSERPPRSAAKSERPPRSKSDRPRTTPAREERAAKRSDPRAEPPSEPKQPIAGQSARPGGPPSAPVRPAAIFGQAKPQQSSIFGEDIISDKSLDEVILSYLAEDLEEGPK